MLFLVVDTTSHFLIKIPLFPGTKISQLFVKDEDDPSSLEFKIHAEKQYADFFAVDPKTGVITLNKPLDLQVNRIV